MVLSKEHKLSQ